jgi:hypothetical protein
MASDRGSREAERRRYWRAEPGVISGEHSAERQVRQGESILAQNPVVGRVELPAGVGPLVYLGSGPADDWELGAPISA